MAHFKTPRWLSPILCLGLAILACGSEPAAPPTSRPDPDPNTESPQVEEVDELVEQVDELVAELVGEDTPGVAVLVVREGQILQASGYGLANLEDEKPITSKTIFHLASVGKQFTALAIMQLYEAGEIDYDEPISTYLPELADGIGDEVTIRHLLYHTSGIPDDYDGLTEAYDMPTNDDALAYLAENFELDFEPGEQEEYCNYCYDLLGTIIEHVTGQSFDAYMQANIFKPLGMTQTFSYNAKRLSDPLRATGYTVEGDDEFTVYDSDPADLLVGSGSIFTSLDDLYRYDQALANNKIVKARTLAEAFKPGELNDGTELEYGFGWELGEYNDEAYIAHSGSWVGFTSYMLRVPELELAVYLLSNRDDTDTETLSWQIADIYWGK